MDIEAIGKLLGMVLAYNVSALGLLLAYYNYRKRVIKAEQIFTPTAKAVIGSVVGVELFGLIVGAAAIGPGEGTALDKIVRSLPGMIFPAVVFSISYYLTWLLFKHFTGRAESGETK